MKLSASVIALSCGTLAVLMMSTTFHADQNKPRDIENKGETKTIRGVVRDLYCPMQNLGGTSHDFDVKCAVMCLRAGSPVVIQTDDDEFYFPLADAVPDTDQHPRLMPFAAKRVEATGVVRSRSGVHTIEIKEIHELDADKK